MTTHVVALSGGKDSTAMALRLRELFPQRQYRYVCTPTGDETEEMQAHWAMLDERLGGIEYLSSGETLDSLIRAQAMLPNAMARWCTRILKIEPCIEFLEGLDNPILYVGLRADEETREGGVYGDVPQSFPLREWGWSLNEVNRYLLDQGVRIPRRTDCKRCYHQRLGEWWNLWRDDRASWEKAEAQEAFVSSMRHKNHTFRNDSRDSWPASLAGLRAKFEQGHIPSGADVQLSMFEEESGDRCRVCSM